jgi:hypothetical protein
MDTPDKTPTHTAFAIKRSTKGQHRLLEIGDARIEEDGKIHVFLDRLPIGGFNGYVLLNPKEADQLAPDVDMPDEDDAASSGNPSLTSKCQYYATNRE